MMKFPLRLWLEVVHPSGKLIRRIDAPHKKCFHRVDWDLRYPRIKLIKKGEKLKIEIPDKLCESLENLEEKAKQINKRIMEAGGPPVEGF